MSANLVSDRPASISILRILGMVVLGYIIMGNVVALLVISLLYEGNFMEAMTDPVGHPDIRNTLVIAQGLASLVGLVLIPAFYLKNFEGRSTRRLFINFPSGLTILLLFGVVITLAIAISPVADWNSSIEIPGSLGQFLREFEDQAAVLVKAFVANLTPATFLLVFVVIAVIPAWGEELVFRGLIQNEFVRAFRNPHVGIWLTAAFFSAFHLQFFGFFPRLFIGVVLGYVYYWSGNLWVPVTLHFLNNGLQITAIYLMQLKVHNFDVESTESAPFYLVAISLPALTFLLYYFKKHFTSPPANRDATPELQ